MQFQHCKSLAKIKITDKTDVCGETLVRKSLPFKDLKHLCFSPNFPGLFFCPTQRGLDRERYAIESFLENDSQRLFFSGAFSPCEVMLVNLLSVDLISWKS